MLNTIGKLRLRAASVAGSAAIVAGGLTMLASHSVQAASYTTDCSTVDGGGVGAGPVHVYTNSRVGATAGAGVCLDPAAGFGGDLEAGASTSGQAYAILDGNNNNPSAGPVGLSGYAGISNYETGSSNPGAWDAAGCQPAGSPPGGGGTNGGGAFMAKPLCSTWFGLTGTYGLPLPIACGFNSGPTWDNTPRDGCFFP